MISGQSSRDRRRRSRPSETPSRADAPRRRRPARQSRPAARGHAGLGYEPPGERPRRPPPRPPRRRSARPHAPPQALVGADVRDEPRQQGQERPGADHAEDDHPGDQASAQETLQRSSAPPVSRIAASRRITGVRSERPRPLREPRPAPAAREPGDGLGAVEAEALAVKGVDELARLGVVEGDHLDHVFPAQRADVDPGEGGLEPVAEPGVALAGVVFDPAADLAADRVGGGVPDEDAVVDPGLRGDRRGTPGRPSRRARGRRGGGPRRRRRRSARPGRNRGRSSRPAESRLNSFPSTTTNWRASAASVSPAVPGSPIVKWPITPSAWVRLSASRSPRYLGRKADGSHASENHRAPGRCESG